MKYPPKGFFQISLETNLNGQKKWNRVEQDRKIGPVDSDIRSVWPNSCQKNNKCGSKFDLGLRSTHGRVSSSTLFELGSGQATKLNDIVLVLGQK